MAWLKRDAPNLALAVALLLAAALVIGLSWDLTFYQDTWAILMERQGDSAEAFLKPHNEHLIVFQVALEKSLIGVFGMTSARPEFLVMVGTLLVSASLLYVYVRRRTSPWLAVMAAVILLFLGTAWQVVLWPFEIEFVVPVAAGIGALLMLEREDRAGDLLACLLLVVGLGFGSLGLSFVLAALVDVFLKRGRRGWGRVWIAAPPLLLYGAWYLGWGRDAEHHMTLANLVKSPFYAAEGLTAAVGALVGLEASNLPAVIAWLGVPAAAALALYILWRRRAHLDRFWPVAAAGLSYWLLAAFNYIPGREPWASRYVYAGAVFVLLAAAELLRGVRLGRRAILICGAVTALALVPNIVHMVDGADRLREQTVLTRADTGAMEIASGTIADEFRLGPEIAGTPSLINIDAADYFAAVEKDGSPAYSVEELVRAPELGRAQADIVLAAALPISALAKPGGDPGAGGCAPIGEAGRSLTGVPLAFGATRIVIGPGPQATLRLRRFATGEFPYLVGSTEANTTVTLDVPRDRAVRPWFLRVEGAGNVSICR